MTIDDRTELQMMQSPPAWPLWPCLPLKRNKDTAHGVLWAQDFDGKEFRWYEGVLVYDPEAMGKLLPKDGELLTMQDFQKRFIDQGWVVD